SLLLSPFFIYAQTSGGDTLKNVEILNARILNFKKSNNSDLQILSGDVQLRQNTTLFNCDSCVINNTTKVFEAFGNVHIIDDTTNIYSKYLRYLIEPKKAYLKGNVRLNDGHSDLTTNDLEYNVADKIGVYKNGGKVVSKTSVLTSKEGVYYADLHDIYFKQDVILDDPAYHLTTDSLLYNSESQMTRFIAETFLRDSSGRTVRTTEGTYNLKSGSSQFTQRTTIIDGPTRIVGNQIASDDSTGLVQILGNGVLIDTAQGISILANEIFADRKKAAYLATRKPLMIIKQEKDSIYVTADTLFSAKLSDRFTTIQNIKQDSTSDDSLVVEKDTVKAKTPVISNDSTDRYFEAFRHVRIFSDSVQAVSDSLFYSFKDSTFQLFRDPLVWTNGSQMRGDTIYLYTKNKKADRIRLFENGFLINQLEPGVFNQVRAKRMDGYFKEGIIDSVRARGAAESIYYIRDEDSAYSGINQSSSDIMDVYFKEGDLNKVVFRSNVKGTLWPASDAAHNKLQLKDFQWLDARRPKTKYELYE
ncbi:MAG TPA: OstA-like protein, partial [Chitinophagaceae bacterium]|nr:OstA-like protein [Chitinophagaceae bacterium]